MPRIAIRKSRGSGIVEGVVGLLMIIGGTVLAVLLLLNAGTATYNKEKIGFISNEAATYASTLADDGARQGLVTDMVEQQLTSMGFNSAGSTVVISDTTIASKPAVKVTVTATLPTLLSTNFANVLPQQIQMSDTAVAVKNVWFWGYGVGTLPDGQKLTFPMVNPTGALPSDGLPAYSVSIVGMSKIR